MMGITKEWKRNPDTHADIHPYYIQLLVDYEFRGAF